MLNTEKSKVYSWVGERINDIRLRSFFESDKPEFQGLSADEIYKKLLVSEMFEPLGKLIVYPERMADWLEYTSVNGTSVVAEFLTMLSAYSKHIPVEEIKTMVDDHHGFISNAVLYFYKKGPDFYKSYNPDYKNNPDTVEFIERVEQENDNFRSYGAYIAPKSMQ